MENREAGLNNEFDQSMLKSAALPAQLNEPFAPELHPASEETSIFKNEHVFIADLSTRSLPVHITDAV